MSERKVIVILGPTALGKTDIGLKLAREYGGELVACDSRQIYKGMDIGTGKMPSKQAEFLRGEGFWIIDGVKVWLYDIIPPSENFNVKEYVELAERVIEKIFSQNKIPIIVGGSGLYLKGLLEGLSSFNIPSDPKFRFFLENLSLETLQRKLKRERFEVWGKMNESDRANKRRLIRKLEIAQMEGYKTEEKVMGLSKKYSILKIGLTAPKKVLNKRIDDRVEKRVKSGLIQEGIKLHTEGLSFERMRSFGLEYSCLVDILEGKINKEEFIARLKVKIHQYAKRQTTWFQKEKDVKWFAVSRSGFKKEIENFVSGWLGVIESPK